MPSIGERIVLIKSTESPTKAGRWAPAVCWDSVMWCINAQKTFRAIAYDHRTNGHFQGNSKTETILCEDTLLKLTEKFGGRNPYGNRIEAKLGNITLSSAVRWERQDTDGVWTECLCPLS